MTENRHILREGIEINIHTHIILTFLVVAEHERGGFRRMQDQTFNKKKCSKQNIEYSHDRMVIRDALWSPYFM